MKQSTILFSTLLLTAIVCSFMLVIRTTQAPESILGTHEAGEASVPQKAKLTYMRATAQDITVELPVAESSVGKEFGVVGKARGSWFFEATFPIEVRDPEDTLIASGYASALGEWMTEELVQFVSEITITTAYTGPATLILKKQNASGEPERDASVSLPITIGD